MIELRFVCGSVQQARDILAKIEAEQKPKVESRQQPAQEQPAQEQPAQEQPAQEHPAQEHPAKQPQQRSVFEQPAQEPQQSAQEPTIPWDARIHTKNKARKANGEFKRRPGVDDAYYEQVVNELTQTAASGAPNHSELLDRITRDFMGGNLSPFQITDALRPEGINQLPDASGNPEMIERIACNLGYL